MTKDYSVDPKCTFCGQYTTFSERNYWGKTFGKKYNQTNDVLWSNEEFTIVAGLGAISVGYLMLVPKQHIDAIGCMSEQELRQLEKIKDKLRAELTNSYNLPVVFFEHGSTGSTSKSCIPHAHLHIIPTNLPFLERIEKDFKMMPLTDITQLRDIALDKDSYLFFEDQEKAKYVYVSSTIGIPSQYIRKIWAEMLGKPDLWDWELYIEADKIAETIRSTKLSLSGHS